MSSERTKGSLFCSRTHSLEHHSLWGSDYPQLYWPSGRAWRHSFTTWPENLVMWGMQNGYIDSENHSFLMALTIFINGISLIYLLMVFGYFCTFFCFYLCKLPRQPYKWGKWLHKPNKLIRLENSTTSTQKAQGKSQDLTAFLKACSFLKVCSRRVIW